MASTSSLEFLGCTVSCCSTGCCCTFCDCPDRSSAFAGSGVGGGLCARALTTVNAPRSADLIIRRRISCMHPPPLTEDYAHQNVYKRCDVFFATKFPSLLGSAS